MSDLLEFETQDVRAAEAVAVFCHEVKKRIGSFAAALGGLDSVRRWHRRERTYNPARICEGLSFLGIQIDEQRNAQSESVISTDACHATVRVVHTDEEQMIAHSA